MKFTLALLASALTFAACSGGQTGPCTWDVRAPAPGVVRAVGHCDAPVPGLGMSVPLDGICTFAVGEPSDATPASR